MDQRNDRDLIIKARFRFTEDDEDDRTDASTSNMHWNQMILSDDAKTPCYAFRRGNILFTTIPPARAQPPPIQKSCTSTCKINVAERSDKRHGSDFCEVCCGIRSPSFSRRAHSFTTHFCTRVPAKKSNKFTNYSSDQRSKSTDSSVSSSVSSVNQNFGNLISSRGHISRLSAYLKRQRQPYLAADDDDRFEEATSSDCTSETSSSCDTKSNDLRSRCDKCGLSSTGSTLATSRSSAMSEFSSYSSSYPSSCSSYVPFFLDESCSSSVCCECSGTGANSTLSSFNSLRIGGDRKKSQQNEKARFFSNDSSTDSDNETCSSEMGWSFSSFCPPTSTNTSKSRSLSAATVATSVEKSHSVKKEDNKSINSKSVTPFVSSSNRKLVMEKFGDIVSSLRKPGHHVGPSKNADCLCDNCRCFFSKK